jgi:predicted DNA-binding protein (UPF0251 family)/predicted Fe-Mo cluster-binding NifX family protein
VTYFKPRGVPLRDLAETYLTVDGFEAIRLADLAGLTMEEAAARMGVSRHTFGRILAEAHRAVAEALVKGQALRIEGGHYQVDGRAEPREPRRTAGNPGRGPGRGENGGPDDDGLCGRADTRSWPKERDMTKIAVSSEGPTLAHRVDPRFGRAGGFVVVDLETMATTYLDNGASQAMAHGAGIGAAQRISASGAGVLLTGYVGPKAFEALQAAGIKVGQDLDGLTVEEAVNRYKAGQVPFADAPNKE